MELIKLIYTSAAKPYCDLAEADRILETSQRLNSINGITGILYFSNSYFLQYLEGDKAAINETYERITQDKRHHKIRLVITAPLEKREFGEWSMGYIPQSELLTPLNLKFMNGPDFNPKNISPEESLQLIFELRAQLPKAHYTTD